MKVILKEKSIIDDKLTKYKDCLGDIIFGHIMAGILYIFLGGLLSCVCFNLELLFMIGVLLIACSFVFVIYVNVRIRHDIKEASVLFEQAYLSRIETNGKFIIFYFKKDKEKCTEVKKDFWCFQCSYSAELDENTIIVDYKTGIVYVSGLYLLNENII